MITAIILMCEVASGNCVPYVVPKPLEDVSTCEYVAERVIEGTKQRIINQGGHEDNQTFDYQCVGWWKA